MIGHISIAQGMLHEKVAALNAAGGEPFPEKLRLLVEHMILAHHGKLEFGSPKLPMTPEAMLLSALDDLEAKFQAMRGEFAAAKAAGKGPGENHRLGAVDGSPAVRFEGVSGRARVRVQAHLAL